MTGVGWIPQELNPRAGNRDCGSVRFLPSSLLDELRVVKMSEKWLGGTFREFR